MDTTETKVRYAAATDWPKSSPTLEGATVRLEPLSLDHVAGLVEVGLLPEIWQWTTVRIESEADMRGYVETALAEQARGVSLPFATVLRESGVSGKVVGSTRFGNVTPENRRVEIGWTWISPAWQRTAVNTEAKLLMLRYAFETLGCIRVELKTHHENFKSQQAMERLGAVREGVFRNHVIQPDGTLRHSVYYRIAVEDWPAVKVGLEAKLAR